MSDDLSGRTMGRYQVLERLGRGGMAEVYRAYQPSLDRYVAIKVIYPHLSDDQALMERFGREARAVAALRHGNIVQVHDFDVQGGVAFMAMEFINGPTLKSAIQSLHQRRRLLPLPVVGQIVGQIADALAYAHEQQIIHRDVKPANVLLRWRSAGEAPLDDVAIDALLLSLSPTSVVLTDFGVARIIKDSIEQTAAGTILGSPAYMSPEQGRGERADARSDIYSLGVVLYELLTGQVPFDADTPFAVVLKHTTAPLPPPRGIRPDLPEGIERVLLKALAKNPADRFVDAAAFGAAVREQCGVPGAAATLSAAPQPAEPAGPPAGASDPRATRIVELTRVAEAPPAPAATPPAPAPAVPTPARRKRSPWLGRILGCAGLLALIAVVAVAAFLAGGLSVFKGLNEAGAITVPTELAEAATAAAIEGNPFPIATAIGPRQAGTALPAPVQAALDQARAACSAPGCPGGSASAAVAILDAAVAQAPDSPELLAARAQTYVWWDPYTYAEQIRDDVEQALDLNDAYAPAYLARGDLGTYVAEDDDERAEALADLNRALALNPELAAVYLVRARFLSYAPDFYGETSPTRDQVIADASAVIARDPEAVEALLLRANAYYNGNRFDQALADLNATLALEPDNALALLMRGNTHRYYGGDPEAAIADYSAAITAHPENPAARESRLSLLIDQGRFAEARADADALVESDASNPARHALRGHLLLALDELEPALADFERALLLGGDEQIVARYGRGKARLEQGDAAGAIPDLEAAIPQAAELDQIWFAFYSGRRQVYIDLARAYIQAGRADDAGPALDQAIEAEGGWHLPYLLRARLRRESGEIAGAREDLRAALERAGTDAERGEVEDELRRLP